MLFEFCKSFPIKTHPETLKIDAIPLLYTVAFSFLVGCCWVKYLIMLHYLHTVTFFGHFSLEPSNPQKICLIHCSVAYSSRVTF